MQGKMVVVLANLKPRNMRGVKSNGMLLCASDAAHQNVELLSPPEGAVPGERIWFGSEEDKESQKAPAAPNQVWLLQVSRLSAMFVTSPLAWIQTLFSRNVLLQISPNKRSSWHRIKFFTA